MTATQHSSTGISFKPEVTCAIEVSDFKRSAAWYQDVLGFQPIYALDDMGWGEFQTPVPGVTVGLGQVEAGSTAGGAGGAVLTWGVEDINASRAALESKDVRFDGETRTIAGMVKLATFFDPDGNTMMLAESLTAQP